MSNWNTRLMAQAAKSKFEPAHLPPGTNRSSYNLYLDAISGAVGRAIDLWRSMAALTDVAVNGPTATGGTLIAPPLEGLILGYAPAGTWDPYTKAIAAAIQTQMRSFEREVHVPGLPWYPRFAAMPMPAAPPTPNIPCPLLVLAPSGTRLLSEADVTLAITRSYGRSKPPLADEVAKAIGHGFEQASTLWLATTLVVRCMGSGPVPTFAPPYVPVGSVVRGRASMAPGGLV